MLWTILIFVFLTAMFITLSIYYVLYWKRNSIKIRLKLFVQNDSSFLDVQNRSGLTIAKDIRKLTNFIKKIFPHKIYFESKRKKLAQADVLMKPEEFFIICIACGLIIGIIFYFVFRSALFIPLGFILGYIIPNIFLGTAKDRRAKKLNSQLPEALAIISNGLRAGYSIVQAMTVASKEMQEPISDEFNKVIRDNTLGKPFEEALLDMSKKSEDEDLNMFITAMLIQRQVGGNLAEILENISKTIRERVRIRGEIKTLTSESRFSAFVIGLMPIVLALAIGLLNPQYINILVTTQIGIALIIIAIILDVAGILILRKIVNIEI